LNKSYLDTPENEFRKNSIIKLSSS